MTAEEFTEILTECGSYVADEFYPKGVPARLGLWERITGRYDRRRGECIRDLGILNIKLLDALMRAGIVESRG